MRTTRLQFLCCLLWSFGPSISLASSSRKLEPREEEPTTLLRKRSRRANSDPNHQYERLVIKILEEDTRKVQGHHMRSFIEEEFEQALLTNRVLQFSSRLNPETNEPSTPPTPRPTPCPTEAPFELRIEAAPVPTDTGISGSGKKEHDEYERMPDADGSLGKGSKSSKSAKGSKSGKGSKSSKGSSGKGQYEDERMPDGEAEYGKGKGGGYDYGSSGTGGKGKGSGKGGDGKGSKSGKSSKDSKRR